MFTDVNEQELEPFCMNFMNTCLYVDFMGFSVCANSIELI